MKQIRFKKQIDNHDFEKAVCTLTGKETITAGDIGKFLNGFQVLNPELVIAHCEPSVKIKLEITIEIGIMILGK